MRNKWISTNPCPDAYKLASGRRKYNALRTMNATFRRREIIHCVLEGVVTDITAWGCQSELAKLLGVDRSTICRDIKALLNHPEANLLT